MNKTTPAFLQDRPMVSATFPYTTKAHKPLPSDPLLRSDILHVLEHGYVILPDQFTSQVAQAAKSEIDRLSGKEAEAGRNSFEGLKTNRRCVLLLLANGIVL
jgi:hypothetical protein